jgi:hypothetical protein
VSVWFDKAARTWLADCVFCKEQLGFDGYRSCEAANRAVRDHLLAECPEMDDDDRKAVLAPARDLDNP